MFLKTVSMRGVKIHDIETYINLFVFCGVDRFTDETHTFILWDGGDGGKPINELFELITFLNEGHKLVGYNSLKFDGPVLTHIANNYNKWIDWSISDVIKEIYRYAQVTIRDTGRGGFALIPEWQLSNRQLCLLSMWHFDNPARWTRLKDLQIAMDWPTVVDTPIHHTERIRNTEQVYSIIDYCLNDIHSTKEFYNRSRELVDMRTQLSNMFDLPLMSASDSKIGAEIFAKLLSEHMGVPVKEIKKMRTPRSSINIGEVILPYIKFDDIGLKSLLETFTNTTIIETKGGFKKSVKLKGFEFDLGLGGIHGCVRSGVYSVGKGRRMKDIDVKSFYPNLAIRNKFFPAHLGEFFCTIYEQIFNERQQIPKEDVRNYAYKIILNAVFGKSNDKDSYLYDPRLTMQITVNGQLLILMLAEKLMAIDSLDILQANTDGLTVVYDEDKEQQILDICEWWCNLTKLELEYAEYSKMVIKDVNNYIGVYTNGKTKYKGSFEIFDNKAKGFKDWHKDPSFRIVAKAVSEYFINNIPIEETITSTKDVNQFTGRGKFKSDNWGETRCVVDNRIVVEKQQKTTRYIITNSGCQFMKVFEDGREQVIHRGNLVTICNTLTPDSQFDINYKFYINEANKIVEVIEGNKNQLSLF